MLPGINNCILPLFLSSNLNCVTSITYYKKRASIACTTARVKKLVFSVSYNSCAPLLLVIFFNIVRNLLITLTIRLRQKANYPVIMAT